MKLDEKLLDVVLSLPSPVALAVELNGTPGFILKDTTRNLHNYKAARIPIMFQPQMGQFNTGSVFRLYFEVRRAEDDIYKGESFLNVSHPDDLKLLYLFTEAPQISFVMVNEQGKVQAAKAINANPTTQADLLSMIGQAIEFNGLLGDRLDYSAARLEMIKSFRWSFRWSDYRG